MYSVARIETYDSIAWVSASIPQIAAKNFGYVIANDESTIAIYGVN